MRGRSTRLRFVLVYSAMLNREMVTSRKAFTYIYRRREQALRMLTRSVKHGTQIEWYPPTKRYLC